MPRCRLGRTLCAGLLLLPLATLADTSDEIAVVCEFGSARRAVYVMAPATADVRRVDTYRPRRGRLTGEADGYRFIFLLGDYRSEIVIDRANGNARRVFGRRDAMKRPLAEIGSGHRLVHEAGQCRAQSIRLDQLDGPASVPE